MSEAALRFGEQPPGAAQRRALAFAFVALVHLLLGYMLFVLAPTARQKLEEIRIFEARNVAAERTAAKPAATAEKAPQPPPPQTAAKPPPPLDLTFGPKLDQPFDLAKLPNRRAELAQAAPTGGDTPAPIGPGQGPNGEPLYNAQWVREPSKAELAGYLPNGAPPDSWGEIACRTVRGYRVEDCQELDESPRGSHLSSALREAAWQFRVRPPRRGGEPLWGTWVRIRFTFTSGDKPDAR